MMLKEKFYGCSGKVIRTFLLAAASLAGNTLAEELPPLPQIGAFLEGWRFDTTNHLTLRGDPPKSQAGVQLVPTWNTNGARLAGTNQAYLQYHFIDTNGPANLTLPRGSIWFWFRPLWSSTNLGGTGPGSSVRLLELGSFTPDSSYGWLSLHLNAAGTRMYFAGQTNGNGAVFLDAPISWQSNTWHSVILDYTATNSALHADGVLATNGSGVTYWPSPSVLSNGFFIGSDSSGANLAQGDFELIRTYDGPMHESVYLAYHTNTITKILEWENGGGEGLMSGGENSFGLDSSGDSFSPLLGETETNLWLEITGVTNNLAYLTLHNTIEDQLYELLSKRALTDAVWVSEGVVLGMPGQSSIPTGVPTLNRTNALFLRARNVSQDSDGSGLPDWWQSQFFGTLGVDPYGDPDNDGWSNIEEYENGSSPTQFNTPHAPRGLTLSYNEQDGTVTVSWQGSQGPVTGYTLERFVVFGALTNFSISGSATSFEDELPLEADPTSSPRSYRLIAHYALGDSAWSAAVEPFPSAWDLQARVVRGTGKFHLAVAAMPYDTTTLRIIREDEDYPTITVTNFDVNVSSITNGLFELPQPWLPPIDRVYYTDWFVQSLGTNRPPSEPAYAGHAEYPFFDGTQQLRENLAFVLRAASKTSPFAFTREGDRTIQQPAAYAHGDLYDIFDDSQGIRYWEFDEFLPFDDNYVFRNFAFATTNVTLAGSPSTGVYNVGDALFINPLPLFQFQLPSAVTPIPPVLSGDQARWFFAPGDRSRFAITSTSENHFMAAGATNLYGLPFLSAKLAYQSGTTTQFALLNAGGSIPDYSGTFYVEAAQPIFQTVGYYFGRPHVDLFPGHADFRTTNTTPRMVVSVGEPYFRVAGYAKQAILNGDLTRPAYLGQYFDKALLVGTNGMATTNEAGILSEYGDFLPTKPGFVALTTKPDTTQGGIQGTCMVHVISLTADSNHDGVLDSTFGGPDWGTFRFWVNDDDDKGETGGSDLPVPEALLADGTSEFRGIMQEPYGVVDGVRDLIDFFPVYLNIKSLVQALPPSTTVQYRLKQADGALNFIYTDEQPSYLRRYLIDTNVARWVGRDDNRVERITAEGITLYPAFLTNMIAGLDRGVILVEGRAATDQPLVLEVRQGTNVIAQTQLLLSITPVEKMFRHKNLTSAALLNRTNGPADRLEDFDVPNEPETNGKNLVFLHGYNVSPQKARGSFAEMFKRMYWSGSRAKFYGVTWQGSESLGQLLPGVTANYHTNVVNAFLSAPKLRDFLANLNGQNIVWAHSLGNMVALSALSDWDAPISNYFMMDAAVALEAVDGSAAVSTNMIYPDWVSYTNTLYANKWFTVFPSTDARSGLGWSNRLGNFRNTEVYNFYSSGEDVLREYVGTPPLDLFSSVPETIKGVLAGSAGIYAWAWQEKGKGRAAFDDFLASAHGGWRFNSFYDQPVGTRMPPAQANVLPGSQLRTNAFFDFGSLDFFYPDLNLYSANGSQYAAANRNRILADAIPALTLAVGANPVPRLSPQFGDNRNFNMPDEFKNGWPSTRISEEQQKWHHSDFKDVAYTFVYRLFDEFVNRGDLD